jgi:AcrR family transcriptional regulator
MSPRPYKLGQRQAATEQTRTRIIQAARELFTAPGGISDFSIEMVAKAADVARMTVYHQFGSKMGLLEALCDSLAASGGMQQLATAFSMPDPFDALDQFILTFGRFWDEDRLVMRRLRAMAALDPDFEQLIQARDSWRRKGARVLVQRFVEKQRRSPGEAADTTCNMFSPEEKQEPASNETFDQIVDVLFTLTSFETFDILAGPDRGPQEVVPVVQKLARAALGFSKAANLQSG